MEVSQDNFAAFISYRHKPLDIAVAEELIKLIERYRVPKELRKNGSTSLGRVFRDRDELGVHHDLEEAIYPNLDNSDFLIVVCTPDTRDSEWVSLEIERFLQTHDRDHILVVHAAGTAEEAIPEQITHIYDENGNLVNIKNPLSIYLVDSNQQKVLSNLRKEFLKIAAALMHSSYDSLLLQQEYRMPRKKLKNEILRLISALLGCPYDELQQRNKKYLYQRLMIFSIVVASFLLIFAAVVFHKNTQISDMNEQIQEQLRQTQLNESEVLTLMSRQQLEDGDRMEAIRSALAALPSEENERPYYPEALTALTEAMNLYAPEGQLTAHSLLEISGTITDIAISNDGKYAAILNEEDILQYYDITSGDILWSSHHNENPLTDEEEAEQYYLPESDRIGFLFLEFSNDGQRIIHATPTSTCVLSATTGEHIYIVNHPYTPNVTLSADDRYWAVYNDYDGYFLFYDFETGEEISKTEMLPFEGYPDKRIEQAIFSSDNSKFLVLGFDAEYNFNLSNSIMHFYLIDPKTGELCTHQQFEQETHRGLHVTPLNEGGFVVFDLVKDGGSSATYGIYLDSNAEIRSVIQYEGIFSFSWSDTNSEYIVCTDQKDVCIFDIDNGSFLYHRSFDTDIIGALWDENNYLTLMFEDGLIECYHLVEKDGIVQLFRHSRLETDSTYELTASPRQAKNMFCLIPSAYAKYNIVQFISLTKAFGGDPLSESHPDSIVSVFPSGKYFEIGYSGLTIDSTTLKAEARGTPPDDGSYSSFCGYAADETKKIFDNGILYDTISGESKEIELWYDLPNKTKDYATMVTNSGQDISYNEVSYGWYRMLCQEPGEPLLSAVYHEEKIHWWLDDVHYESSPCPFTDRMELIPETTNVIVGENRLILLRIPAEKAWSLDHFTGSSVTAAYVVYSIDDDTWYWLDYPFVSEATYGYIPTSSEKWIACMDKSSNLYLYDPIASSVVNQFKVPFSAESVELMHFLLDDTVILVILDNDYCYFIDVATGTVLLDTIQVDASFDKSIYIDGARMLLYLCGQYHKDSVIIDIENWSVYCKMPEMRGYLSTSNKIVCYNDITGQYVLYPAYSREEIIDIAKKMVGQ